MDFEEIYEKARLRESKDDNPIESDVAYRMSRITYFVELLNHDDFIKRFQFQTKEKSRMEIMLEVKLEKSQEVLQELFDFCIKYNPGQKRISFSQYSQGERQK